jgi:hypothetical protein
MKCDECIDVQESVGSCTNVWMCKRVLTPAQMRKCARECFWLLHKQLLNGGMKENCYFER